MSRHYHIFTILSLFLWKRIVKEGEATSLLQA
jgi:hypothetical protein